MEQKEDGFNIEGDYLYFAGYFKLSNIRIHHTNVVHFTFIDEEVFFEHTNSSPEDEEFDAIVAALDEILLDDAFQNQLTSFYQDNCGKMRT